MVQAADFAKTLQLTVLSPSTQTEWDIRTTDLNRPGMQFCGFYEYFPFERPQVIGKVEMTYLENLEPEARRQIVLFLRHPLRHYLPRDASAGRAAGSRRRAQYRRLSDRNGDDEVLLHRHQLPEPLPRPARNAPRRFGVGVRHGRADYRS